jgi:gamma-tubulin complex component 2
MSANDRRASYMSAPRPRVVSNRVDADRPSRGAASPQQPDNMDSLRTSTSSQKQRLPREQKNMTEKRTERTVITTREKAVRRNPIKESSRASNRGDWDKSKTKKTRTTDGLSPVGHRREPDAPTGS